VSLFLDRLQDSSASPVFFGANDTQPRRSVMTESRDGGRERRTRGSDSAGVLIPIFYSLWLILYTL